MKYLLSLLTQSHWGNRIHGVNAIMRIGDASPYPSSLASGGMQDRFKSQCFGPVVASSTRVTLSLIRIQNRSTDTVAATRLTEGSDDTL